MQYIYKIVIDNLALGSVVFQFYFEIIKRDVISLGRLFHNTAPYSINFVYNYWWKAVEWMACIHLVAFCRLYVKASLHKQKREP